MRTRTMLALGLVFLFGAGTWFGTQWYQQQVAALNLKNAQKSTNTVRGAGRVEVETGYVLVKGDSAVLSELLAEEGIAEDAKLDGGIVRLKIDSEVSTVAEVVDRGNAKLKAKNASITPAEAFVEPDYEYFPEFEPNDPDYPSQWHLPRIAAPAAWDTSTGSGVTIAIADSGVDCTHPDLAANCVNGYNFYDRNTNTADVYGHGTKVAGAAAAVGNNAQQVAGVGYGAKIMPLRVSSTSGGASASLITEAIRYAADNGAKLVNVSFAAYTSSAVQDAATYMRSKGGIVTMSAGNSATFNSIANHNAIMVVSATNGGDGLSSFSNTGNMVDFAAPGEGILTTINGGSTSGVAGTSFSAPIMAGAAGVVFAARAGIAASQVESVLSSTARDLGSTGWDTSFGWGIIDLGKAVEAANAGSAGDSQAPTTPSNLVATPSSSSAISLNWTASTDNVGVAGYDVYRGTVKLTTTTATSYVSVGLIPSTTYTYTVVAFDAAGNYSAASSPASATTLAQQMSFTAGPSVPVKTATTATITWSSSVAGDGVIEYGTTKNLGSSISDTQVLTSHSVDISGLKAKTTYYFRVKSTAPDGRTVTSAISSFRTKAR